MPTTAPAGYSSGAESAALRKTCGSSTLAGWAQKMNFASMPRSTPQQPSHRPMSTLQSTPPKSIKGWPWPRVVFAGLDACRSVHPDVAADFASRVLSSTASNCSPAAAANVVCKQLQPCRCCPGCRGVLPSSAASHCNLASGQGILPSSTGV